MKYFRENIFDRTFEEISEKDFEEEVINFRNLYTLHYYNTYRELTDNSTGLHYRVYY